MCKNEVNAPPLKMILEHIDEQAALNRRWVHKLFHSADGVGYAQTATTLKEAQNLLDEVLVLLASAKESIDKEMSDASGVTINLV